jgi:large subunit ribosomal protein L25
MATGQPQPIKMNYNYLLTKLRQGRFLQTLFNLKVEGQPDVHVICRGVQRDVVKDLPTHVDFMRIHRRQPDQAVHPRRPSSTRTPAPA